MTPRGQAAALLVLTTAPDPKTARAIARRLVSGRLAACVSVKDGFISYYRWKGKIEKAGESLLFIKTSKGRYAGLEKALKFSHPYQVPEIISFPVWRGSSEYLSWLHHALK